MVPYYILTSSTIAKNMMSVSLVDGVTSLDVIWSVMNGVTNNNT